MLENQKQIVHSLPWIRVRAGSSVPPPSELPLDPGSRRRHPSHGSASLSTHGIEDGDYTKAERLAHEAYRAFEDSGKNWSSSVVCIEVLGLLAIMQRQHETAKAWIERGLEAAQEIDFKYSMQIACWQLGYVAALEEKYPEAGFYWQKAMEVSERMLGGRSFIGLGSAAKAKKPL